MRNRKHLKNKYLTQITCKEITEICITTIFAYQNLVMKNLKKKTLYNLTEEEMILLMPQIKAEVIRIVYKNLHRPYNQNNEVFGYQNNIGVATLYRYLKAVKRAYKDLTT